MKKIMVLGASILQVPVIQKAKEMGLFVIVADMNPNAVGFRYADVALTISTIDIEKVFEAAKEYEIDGILTAASDMPMRTVAFVAEHLGLPGIDTKTAVKVTNKIEMRKALQAGNVPIPEFYRVSDLTEYKHVINKFSVPYIIKPADNSGSRGIYKLSPSDSEEVVVNAYEYCRRYSRNGDVVVEEFMQGKEVSVETLSINGDCHVIQITDKLTTGAPYFVEMGHTQPTNQSPEVVDQIIDVAVRANHAVGIINGPSHTEMMITSDGPKIVELGARLGGDCITTHLVPYSTGVDMVESCIKIALGEDPCIERGEPKAAAIRYLDSRAGKVTGVYGVEEARKLNGIKVVDVACKEGDLVNDIINSSERIGFVISQADTVEQAVETCKLAKGLIDVVIE